jgi:hypothetical protein
MVGGIERVGGKGMVGGIGSVGGKGMVEGIEKAREQSEGLKEFEAVEWS